MKQRGLNVIQRAQRVMLGLNFRKMASLTFSGLRGYDVYHTTWRPRIDEILSVKYKAALIVMQSQQSSSVEMEAYRWSRFLVICQRKVHQVHTNLWRTGDCKGY